MSEKKLNINYSQKGIPHFPDFGTFVTFTVKEAHKARNLWQKLAHEIENKCDASKGSTVVVRGVGYELAKEWFSGPENHSLASS